MKMKRTRMQVRYAIFATDLKIVLIILLSCFQLLASRKTLSSLKALNTENIESPSVPVA